MTEGIVEAKITLAEQGKEIGSIKHRLKAVEEQQKSIHELAMAVKELALNMQHMLEEQKEQGKRLELLEKEPARRYNQVKTVFITAMITTLVSWLIGSVFIL
jgi:hypothetical protein